jgi:prophage maintenance system killer protein
MEYMTTHDIVWINSSVTGKVNPFDYIKLEAAMAAQYQYGKSDNVTAQAAFFLNHLLTKPAFAEGNLRTAFIATLTFLNANGYATKVNSADAAKIVIQTATRDLNPADAISQLAAPAEKPLTGLTLRQLITHECNLHVDALKTLAAGD